MGTFIAVIIGIIVVVVIVGALFVYDTLAWSLVLFKFWGWFVLPVFVTLPVLTFMQALGLMFVIGLFKAIPSQSIKKEFREKHHHWAILLAPWISLFFGYLAYAIWLM